MALKGNDNAEKIWNYLIGKGLGSVTTAAIMGNMYQESGFEPDNENPDPPHAYGICQWTEGRKAGLEELAASKGVPRSDLEAQLDWLWTELTGSESEALAAAQACGDDLEAQTVTFCRKFERCGEAEANNARRLEGAQEALEKQGKGMTIASSYKASMDNKSGLKKGACATDRGFKVRGTLVEKVPDKTFCEPVYPDYITVSDTMPAWALTMEQDLAAAKNEDPTGKIIKNGDAPEKAPNGMNYYEEDIKTRMEAKGETREQAVAALSKEPKYNTPIADNGDGTFTVTGKADKKPAENNAPKDGDAKETAPNGKHYFENDIKYLLDHNKGMTREQAIAVLAQDKKYAKEAEK